MSERAYLMLLAQPCLKVEITATARKAHFVKDEFDAFLLPLGDGDASVPHGPPEPAAQLRSGRDRFQPQTLPLDLTNRCGAGATSSKTPRRRLCANETFGLP